MEFANLIFVVATIFVAIPTIQGSILEDIDDLTFDEAEYNKWFQKKVAESYNVSLQAYHPNPYEVINHLNYHVHRTMKGSSNDNSTRRGLRRYKGPCLAENPIDACFRCKNDWAKNRKRLAKCVLGYGRKTTGGADGEFYTVTDPSDDELVEPKPGTLRYGVIQRQPLWIIFKTNMKIKLKAELIVTSDKTIDGRGAQIIIADGAGITIQFANNVIIHNIKIRNIKPSIGGMIRDSWWHKGIRGVGDGDGITVFSSSNIWLDHLSMSNCSDGLIDIVKGSTAITLSNNHFTKHDYVMLFGANDKDPTDGIMQVTLAFNHFGKHLTQRMPRCRFGFVHVVNNDYTHWEMYAIGGTSHPTIISQGNRYTAPDNTTQKEITHRNIDDPTFQDWKNWIWRSENDEMQNGAFFVESGHPIDEGKFGKDFVKAMPGSFVNRLTRFAGQRHCIPGKPC